MKSFLIEPLEARIAPATLTVSPTSGVEGDTDSLPLKFTIRLSEAATTDVQVDYATIDGSALAGSDYQSTQGTLMFPAGTTELMVSVPVIGDTLVEANEGFSLRLSNAVGASLSATPQAAGTIIDDDRTISIAPRTVQEGDPATQALTFTVTLSAAAQSPIAVKYNTADGTATAGEDYTAVTNGTVNFGVGDISKTITISTVGDTRFEADENFKVQLTAVQGDGARLSTDPAGREALGTLTNDDQPPAITSALRVVEGQNAVFTVTLPQALSSAISVPYTTRDGTALDGVDDPAGTVADYTKTSGTLIIPAGQTTAQIVVPVLADALADRGETFTLELGAGAFLRTSTVTIFDAGLSVGDASVTEGQSGTRDAVFTVTLSAAQAEAVTFNYATENGTAIAGSDYTAVSGSLTIPAGATTATIAVPVSGDAVNETDEAFRLRLTLPDTATIGLIDAEATGTIVSDDVAIAVSISDASITEGDSGFSTAVFVVSLSEPVPAGQTRTVHFQTENVGGVESSGAFADYEAIPSGSVVFEAGQTVKTIPVKVFGDRLWEPGNEQFRVRLIDQLVTNTSTNATQTLPVDKVGTGTIVNDDAQPTVSIADVSKLEGDSGNSDAEFRVTLSNPTREGVVIHYSTVAGTATAGTDFDPATDQQITIAPGAMEGTIKVPIVGDVTIEGSETFSVQLASATVQNAAATSLALADGTAVGTIRDDDPRVTIAPATITEGDSGTQQMLFTVRLSAPVPATGGPVTVKYATQDGTAPDGAAKAGEDYIAVGDGTLVFAAGEQEKTIAIAVVGDTRFEQATETFKVLLTSVTGFSATLGNSDATGTITDADPLPTISPSLRVVEGGNAVFTLTIPTAAEADISVPYLTKDGTAIDGVNDGASAVADYAARAGTATILKGQTSATVSIPVFNDVAADSGETFTVEFGSDTRVQTRTVTITEVGASIDDTFVVEGNAGSAKSALFTVRLSAPLAADATFAYQLAGGTATAGTDFDATGGTVTVLAGQTTATISVPIIGDATVEPDETFTVRLLDSTNPAVALSDDTATGTIRNDESVFAISAVDGTDTVTVSEEGNDAARLVTLKITRSGDTSKPASAHYRTVDGVAGADVRGATGDSSRADFAAVADGVVNFAIGETSKTITVQVNGDDRFENKERFSVALVESLSSNAAVSETQGAATVVITETDAVPTVSVTGATIAEPSAAGESGNLAFTVTLSAANEVNAVTLNYATIDGTAKAPGDYTALPATALIFAAGETSKTVLVAVKGDAVDEATEQFSLELSGATNATFGLAGTEPRTKLVAAGTITDNDAPPLLSIGDITVGEGGSAVFSVTLSAPSERAVFVQYVLADGTAKGGADFGVGTPETLSFAPGETSKTISVPTTDDLLFEATENFTVRLVNPQNAALSDSTATGAILDNDSAVLTISDVQVDEGGPGAQTRMLFTVQRSGFLGQTVSVSYVAIDGTAVRTGPDADFALAAPDVSTLVFAPGQTQKTIEVIVFGDDVKELAKVGTSFVDETFKIRLFDAKNAVLASPGGTTPDPQLGPAIDGLGTIRNDDTRVALRIVNTDAIVAEGDSSQKNANFRIELSAPFTDESGTPQKVDFTAGTFQPDGGPAEARRATPSTLDDPATPTVNERVTRDYEANAAKALSIAAGATSVDFSVLVNGDSEFEATEFFSVKIVSVETANVGGQGQTATGIIANDDVRLLNSRTLQWGDENGDLVTLKVSKGSLSGNDFDFATFGLGRVLRALVLSDDGQEFRHANITVTADQDLFSADGKNVTLGDGLANVGYIKAGSGDVLATADGVDLGTVRIDGDLGRIDAGDGFSDPAIRLLDVKSFGTLPEALPAGFSAQSTIIGPLTSLKVAGNMEGFLQVVGKQFGDIGRLNIGALVGGSAASTGTITFTGTLGHAVLGEISGGAGANSGSIQGASDTGTSIGSIKVVGGLVAGVGGDSGLIRAKNIGSVDLGFVEGRVAAGNSGARAGMVLADSTLKTAVVRGSIFGGTATAPQDLTNFFGTHVGALSAGAIVSLGQLGKVRVGGDIVGGGSEDSGAVLGLGNVRAVTVEGAIIGGTAAHAGEVRATGNLGTVKVGAIAGGSGTDAGTVEASGKLALTVEHDVIGGSGARSGTVKAGVISSLAIQGQMVGGTQVNSGSILAGTLVRAEFGQRLPQVSAIEPSDVFTIVGGVGNGSGAVSASRIGKVLVHGSVVGGQGTGSGGFGSSGALGSLGIDGNLTGGFVAVVDDQSQGIRTGFVDAASIGKITIGGSILGGNVLNSGSINATGKIGSVSVGKDLLNVGGADALILAGGTTAGVAIERVEVGGRVAGAQIIAGQSFLGSALKSSAAAQIGSVLIRGSVASLSVIAGGGRGADGIFGTTDDVVLAGAGVLDNANIFSRIASVIIRGAVLAQNGDGNPFPSSGIVAQQLVSIRVGAAQAALPLTPGAGNDLAPRPVAGVSAFQARELPVPAAS